MKKIESYLQHIEGICGDRGKFYKITDEGEAPPISVISFADVPESGCLTAFSFGLSSIAHREWVNSRPELVISVNSLDSSWPLAMGELIRNGRDRCLFSYGMILNFGQPVSEESLMSYFLVYACTVLDESDLAVHLPDRKVHLSQLYPVHQSEVAIIKDVGAEKFVHHLGIDLFDVKRAPHVVETF
ncbi:MAG: suppressor of fused domain protein [Verrucomicrobiota bacterium]